MAKSVEELIAEEERKMKRDAWNEGWYWATNGKWGPGENPYYRPEDDEEEFSD